MDIEAVARESSNDSEPILKKVDSKVQEDSEE